MKISVLSLGWEYPPYIEGGLGVAFQGLNEALSQHVQLKAIIPDPGPVATQDNPTWKRTSYELVPVAVPHQFGAYLYEADTTQTLEVLGVPEFPEEKAAFEAETTLESYLADPALVDESVRESIEAYAGKVLSEIAEAQFDLIHTHDWMTCLAAFRAGETLQCPVVYHVHSLEYDRNETPWDSWIYEVEKLAMSQADGVIAVSEYTRTIIVQEYEIDPDKVHVVHNGVAPVQAFRTPKPFPETLILFLGRLTYQKGPEVFISMAKEVLSQREEVRFAVAGKGDQLPDIVRFVAESRIGDRVHFTGHLAREEVKQLLSMADIFVMPSVSEPFGLVALEAAQFGVPCIISKHSGVSEIFPPACLADPNEIDQWVAAILGLLQFPEWRQEQVAEIQNRIQDLTWEKAAHRVLSVYKAMLSPA